MKRDPIILLGDNHRRGITTAFRLLDEMLFEFEDYARGREVRSVFYQERNALSAGQKGGLLAEIKRMRDLMQEIKDALGLKAEVENVARRIWGSSSAFWVVLVETKSKYMKRYGDAPPELAEYLDPRIEVLIEHLRNLTGLVGGRTHGKAPLTEQSVKGPNERQADGHAAQKGQHSGQE